MKTRIKMLKVKIKSLAEEARIIRREERKAKGTRKSSCKWKDMQFPVRGGQRGVRNSKYLEFYGRDDVLYKELRDHRIKDLRTEQRSALLAYAFLRGKDYQQVERKKIQDLNWPDWNRVAEIVVSFGPTQSRLLNTKVSKEAVKADLNNWWQGVFNPHKRQPAEVK